MLDVLSRLSKNSFYGLVRAAASAAHGRLQLGDDAPARISLRRRRFDADMRATIARYTAPIVTKDEADRIMEENGVIYQRIEREEFFRRDGSWLRTPHDNRLPPIPFTEDELKRYKGTHVLVLVVPFSILEMAQMYPSLLNLDRVYDTYPFASEKINEPAWHLIRKGKLPSSLDYRDGANMPVGEVVCAASIVAFAAIAYQLKTGKNLFTGCVGTTGDAGTDHVVAVHWLEGKDQKIGAYTTFYTNPDYMITEVAPY